MRMRRVPGRGAVVSGSIALLTLTGCTGNSSSGPGLMHGTGMMGAAPGYHFSTPTCSAPATLPGRRVSVMLGDMGMTQMMGGTAPLGAHMMLRAAPSIVTAGTVSVVAANMGWRTHEVVVLPLAKGVPAGQRVPGADGKVDERGSLGEASASCGPGSGEGILAGTTGWMTMTLAPGRYELVCNLKNHYSDGMHQELLVTP